MQFVRKNPQLAELGNSLRKEYEDSLHSDSHADFLLLLQATILVPFMKHNSNTHPAFYAEVMEALQGSPMIQNPNNGNADIGELLNYVEIIKYTGHSLVVSMNMGLDHWDILDLEPVFNVFVYDEERYPVRTLAFRFSVGARGELKLVPGKLEEKEVIEDLLMGTARVPSHKETVKARKVQPKKKTAVKTEPAIRVAKGAKTHV